MEMWKPKPWRRLCRKFLGPLLPKSAEQAATWMGHRPRLRIGFATVLVRKERDILVLDMGRVIGQWTTPSPA